MWLRCSSEMLTSWDPSLPEVFEPEEEQAAPRNDRRVIMANILIFLKISLMRNLKNILPLFLLSIYGIDFGINFS